MVAAWKIHRDVGGKLTQLQFTNEVVEGLLSADAADDRERKVAPEDQSRQSAERYDSTESIIFLFPVELNVDADSVTNRRPDSSVQSPKVRLHKKCAAAWYDIH